MTDVFDPAALLHRLDGNWETLTVIAGMLQEDGPRLLSEMRDALAADDRPSLAAAAHTFKGMVANFLARRATAAAQELELRSRSADESLVRDALGALEEENERLRAALDGLLRDGRP